MHRDPALEGVAGGLCSFRRHCEAVHGGLQVARAPQRRHAATGWRGTRACALIPARGRVAPLVQSAVATVITDPLFYLLATVAVILLGLSKGGFFGLGVMALPLMSL